MSPRTAIVAFAHRGARRGTTASFLVYSGVLVAALVLLAAWIAPAAAQSDAEMLKMWAESPTGYYPNTINPAWWTTLGLADVFACFVLTLVGFVIAPAMIAAGVANERRAGTLDQLRTTPLSPLGLAAGIVVGVPARLYLLCAGPLALHVVAGVVGPLSLAGAVSSLAVLAAGTFASCALALCVALAPRQESGGTFAALGVAVLLGNFAFMAGLFAADRHVVAWSFLHPAGAFDAVMLSGDPLWRRMALGVWAGPFNDAGYRAALVIVPLASVAASLILGAILARAACRKLAAPQLPLFGKTQAVALFVFAATVVVGPLAASGKLDDFDACAAYGFSLALLPVVVAVGLFATPTFEAWAMSLRRGARLGWRHDDAAPHRAVWVMLALWGAAAAMLARGHGYGAGGNEALAVAWAALVAASLPVYFLFASTRYATVAARWAFGVAVGAHLVMQTIAIGIVRNREVDGVAGTFVTMCALAGVAVPAWTAWRQRVLRQRTVAR